MSAGLGAGRNGDASTHGGLLTATATSVLAEGIPAATLGDMHTCPMLYPTGTPHPPVPAGMSTNASVRVEGKPWLRVNDVIPCPGPPCTLMSGAATVLIGAPEAMLQPSDQQERNEPSDACPFSC